MKYYKDTAGNVYAYNVIQTPKVGLFEMTPEEVRTHLNPPPTTEQIAEQVRAERDAALSQSDWIVQRHQEQTTLGGGTTIDNNSYYELLQHRQELRNLPTHPDFPNCEVPILES